MPARPVIVAGTFALLNFDKILTRADVSSLEKWIGTPAVKLLKRGFLIAVLGAAGS